jgi:hypothetical protein
VSLAPSRQLPVLDWRSPSGAYFDPSQRYRYTLWRTWQADLPTVVFVMLNPSTADASCVDPTVRRCLNLAQSWGFGRLEVVNLFAFRTPYPRELRRVKSPVGKDNDRFLLDAAQRANAVVLAWGNQGGWLQRDQVVLDLLQPDGRFYCLGKTQAHQPRHPLYSKRDTPLHPLASPVRGDKRL